MPLIVVSPIVGAHTTFKVVLLKLVPHLTVNNNIVT